MDPSVAGLRLLREVAECGSFTTAAERLGYTQSAASRQAATLERSTGRALFVRSAGGARLTAAGRTLLGHARTVLDALADAEEDLAGRSAAERVRLGLTAVTGAALLPDLLDRLDDQPVALHTREAPTPALVRALRAGTVDLALLTSRPPHRPFDDLEPPLRLDVVEEEPLLVAARDGLLPDGDGVRLADLAGAPWIASPGTPTEPLLGVWPGLPGRPIVAHEARDWLVKLRLVGAGRGLTTVPSNLAPLLPAGVRAHAVLDGPQEVRRLVVARLPGQEAAGVRAVVDALVAPA